MKKSLIFLALFGIPHVLFPMEEGNSKNTKNQFQSSLNNNATHDLAQLPIKKALICGSHERFTSILQPYNKTHDVKDIVKLIHQEDLTIAKFISSFFNYRWMHLYFNMLVKNKTENPKLKTVALLKESSDLNNAMIDPAPTVQFSDSIPANLQSLINNIVDSHSLLSKKYFYVKTFKDEPKTLKESDGKLITFIKNGEIQLNIEVTSNEEYNKGVIVHEITHAIVGETWMKERLKKENLFFTKAMNHLVERQADLLISSTDKKYAAFVQEHLEVLHKEEKDDGSETHPSTLSRLEDIIYLNKLLEAEEKLQKKE
ncbi:MAG TPA: hypothetical protein VHO47_02865 [Candidatus Babeliales bacterium]|nr:hypothetical protein [Candidatus Babeliales bacterium]